MMKPFIQDDERVLSSTTDLLKTSVYAENLVKVIEMSLKTSSPSLKVAMPQISSIRLCKAFFISASIFPERVSMPLNLN